MATELLATELCAPRPNLNTVPRPRLISILSEAGEQHLTLVCAPAGYGKTSLVSRWLQEQDISAAWLSLDERDNAFDERINKFNRSMNRGYRLSKWFVKEFGSTQCQAITGCDFSDSSGVSDYIEGDCITKCRKITEKVAERVQQMLADETRRD